MAQVKYKLAGNCHGQSMAPFINPGDKIYIHKYPEKDKMSLGDIIVFIQDRKLVNHRIISKKNGRFITKGDNNISPDKPIAPDKIFGKVLLIKGQYGSIDLETPLAGLLKYFYLFFSIATFIVPVFFYQLLHKIIRGRRFFARLMARSKQGAA